MYIENHILNKDINITFAWKETEAVVLLITLNVYFNAVSNCGANKSDNNSINIMLNYYNTYIASVIIHTYTQYILYSIIV